MIEQAMFFGLGFFTAILLALACLPAVWNRAARLSMRRLRQIVPLSMDEIIAERDQIRAGFAVEQRRQEQKLEKVEALRAEAVIERGRAENAAAQCAIELEAARATAEAARMALERALRDRYDVEGQAGTLAVALHDVTDLAERRRWEVLDAHGLVRAKEVTIDEGRGLVAVLEGKIAGLEARVLDLRAELAAVQAETTRLEQALRESAAREAEYRADGDLPALRQAIAKIADDVLGLAVRPGSERHRG